MIKQIEQILKAKEELDWVVELVSKIRSIRSQMNVPSKAEFPLYFVDASSLRVKQLSVHEVSIKRLAKLSALTATNGSVRDSIKIVMDEATFYLSLEDVIDLKVEKKRLEKEITKLEQEIGKLEKKLANDNFISRAPAEVVSEQRERLANNQKAKSNLQISLEQLIPS